MSKSRRQNPTTIRDPERPPSPIGRRVAAFDFGERRIGIVITDPNGSFVTARQIVERVDLVTDRVKLDRLLDSYQGATLVVGLPLHEDGSESEQAARTRRWVAQLLGQRPEMVVWLDERLTTEAGRSLGLPDSELDLYAAEVLLMDYLRGQKAC